MTTLKFGIFWNFSVQKSANNAFSIKIDDSTFPCQQKQKSFCFLKFLSSPRLRSEIFGQGETWRNTFSSENYSQFEINMNPE